MAIATAREKKTDHLPHVTGWVKGFVAGNGATPLCDYQTMVWHRCFRNPAKLCEKRLPQESKDSKDSKGLKPKLSKFFSMFHDVSGKSPSPFVGPRLAEGLHKVGPREEVLGKGQRSLGGRAGISPMVLRGEITGMNDHVQ